MNRYGASAGFVCAALVSWSGSALAQGPSATNTECARAYEQAQEQRKSGELITARATLQSCARDECPEFIRTDCTTWYEEVQNEVPTLVFAARSQGRDLSNVQVALGDRVLATRLDGEAVELDPGEFDFVFRAPSLRPLTQHFVIARGERNRLIQVELEPEAGPSFEPPASASARAHSPSLLVPGLFAGVGVLGVAGFAGLGAWGHADENRLESSCSPSCRHDQVSEVRTKYLLADVSLGVGVASLALSAYFFFSGGTSPAQGAALPSRLVLVAAPGRAGVAYGSRF